MNIETIEDLKNFIEKFFKERNKKVKVYLFGSRAKGKATERSDIDLGFLSGQDISYELSLLDYFLENSNLPYKVDLVDLNKVSEEFRKKVIKEGILWINLENS